MAPRHWHKPFLNCSMGGLLTSSTNIITVTRTTIRWAESSSTLKRVVSRREEPASTRSRITLHVAGESDFDLNQQPTETDSEPSNESAAQPTSSPTPFLYDTVSNLHELNTLTHATYQEGDLTYPLTHYDYHAERPTTATATPDYEINPPASFERMEGGEFELPDIPLPIQYVIFACLGLGALWSVLVWLIASPPSPPRKEKHKKTTSRKKVGRHTWWKFIWGRQHVVRQRPVTMPSTYAPLPSGSSAGTTSSSTSEGTPTTATTTATPERTIRSPIRLRKMTPATKQQTPPSPSLPPWESLTSLRNAESATINQHQPHDSLPPPSSPANPFLPPPTNPRSSSEYLTAHHAYFSKPLPTPPPSTTPRPCSHASPYPSRSTSPVSDLDALEAQNGDPRQRSRSTRGVLHIADGVERTGEKLWMGNWVGVVEDGVNRMVDAVVRWTDDDGGEEELLLPMGRREAGGD